MKPISTAAKRTLVPLLAAVLASIALVSTGAALASAPAPGGALLTFIDDSRTLNPKVELADANGANARTLGPGSSAALAPNAGSVAVVQQLPPADDATSELLVYPVGGGTPARLYHCPGFLTLYGWSADSQLILATCPHGLQDRGPLLAINADGGSVTTLATGVIEGASFAPGASNDVVYALARSQLLISPVNLYTTSATGAGTHQITHGWVATNPVWAAGRIVFARTTSRGKTIAPINQLWSIKPNGSGARQLTQMKVDPLAEGLVPFAVSANGKHLLCGFTGTDQSASYAVTLGGRTAAVRLLLGTQTVPDAISRGGGSVLLTNGFEGEPTSVESVPWSGGKPTVLAPHATGASWSE
jgi:hypothetical protein